MCVWTFQQQQPTTVYQSNEHTLPITCIQLSPDGKMAITGMAHKLSHLFFHVILSTLRDKKLQWLPLLDHDACHYTVMNRSNCNNRRVRRLSREIVGSWNQRLHRQSKRSRGTGHVCWHGNRWRIYSVRITRQNSASLERNDDLPYHSIWGLVCLILRLYWSVVLKQHIFN